MSKFIDTVALKQYTPMLHFQWKEDGACLRASEVKPKLDRYAIQYLDRKGIGPEKLPKDWSDYDKDNPEGTHVALRYKMRFSATKKTVDENKKPHLLYFGSIGANRDRIKEACFEGLSMTLVCMSENKIKLPDEDGGVTLLELLKRLLPAFFATHCFGTRSNKGFGSFGVVPNTDSGAAITAEDLAGMLPPDCQKAFYMTYKLPINDGYQMLDNIYVVSSLMKGGVNLQGGIYFKSQLRQYALRNYAGVGSEKAFIKSKVFNDYEKERYKKYCTNYAANGNDQRDARYTKFAFYRALLGLTDNYAYRSREVDPQSRKPYFQKRIDVKPADKSIERFPNPVVFKPDEKGLLVMVHSVPEKLRTSEFKFGRSITHIKPPEEFDLVAFVRECLAAYVDPNPNDNWVNWDGVKRANIFGRNNSYKNSMEGFNKITEIPEEKKGGK